MLFNSFEYLLLFLPISLIVYFLLNRLRFTLAAKFWLVIASLFFYAWWTPRYLPLILASIGFNFLMGMLISRHHGAQGTRRALLALGISGNVALLGYYKYADFLIGIAGSITGGHFNSLDLLLPLGISFFTFTQIAYLVDAYHKKVKEYDLINYALFVTFFPHLIAGPIIHHAEMMPQFKRMRNNAVNYKHLAGGLFLLCLGLFKKVVIADRFAEWATPGFDTAQSMNFFYAWTTSLSYTFQLYFDFSGYTDMALGAALMFNIKLPINFNSPYRALDIQDFWRRWHITLSRFLRDYIYIPLGGNKVQETRIYINLMITFLIGGIWHGAGYTFLIWGFLHGMAILVHRAWKKLGFSLPNWLAWILTFGFVNAAWVFFRAKTVSGAMNILSAMFGFKGIALPDWFSSKLGPIHGLVYMPWKTIMEGNRDSFFFLFAAFMVIFFFKNSNELSERFRPGWKSMLYVAAGVYAILNMSKMAEFLYFNF